MRRGLEVDEVRVEVGVYLGEEVVEVGSGGGGSRLVGFRR